MIALTIHIKGLVQGVGFRPFIYRLALKHHLNGWVVNRTEGVTIKVEGVAAYMAAFIEDIRNEAPVASDIEEMVVDQDMPEGLHGFFILASQDMSDETSEISPDIAICPDCLNDMKSQPHRKDYAFINCTNCGPRFSIVRDFPYDRNSTTMSPFTMCEKCKAEYEDISDRRFHAQPVACHNCGPEYAMHTDGSVIHDFNDIISGTSDLVSNGGIVALKGTGGFHLMCNALDEKAVSALRSIKQREGKPFAVMFRDAEALNEYAVLSDEERRVVTSWRRPIVILKQKKSLAPGIAMGLDTIGAFLPSMPFHYLLFERLDLPAIVLTSGNLADEPIVIENEQALKAFSGITDAVITYNRSIYNRTDDSVVRIISGQERLFRRSRGYTPSPVRLGIDVNGILATGAELSASFCLGIDNRAYLSQHIGDLKNNETLTFYEETSSRFQQIFRIKPALVAADLHPDYLSTRFAKTTGLPLIYVQHHHAHIAACMAENGVDETIIGLAFDGTGYGNDGHIWGSEFMTCDFSGFERHTHFAYMPMPGGDRAAEEPWRMGLSVLYQAYGHQMMDLDIPLLKMINRKIIRQVIESIEKGINCPLTCGMGRLFDAAAAITGICVRSLFHAEAPMRLEAFAAAGIDDGYLPAYSDVISFVPVIQQMCDDLNRGISAEVISARFHNTIVAASVKAVTVIREKTGIEKVAFSGGSFQNKYLHEKLENQLIAEGFTVFGHSLVPCNDGGMALGQLAIAARHRQDLSMEG